MPASPLKMGVAMRRSDFSTGGRLGRERGSRRSRSATGFKRDTRRLRVRRPRLGRPLGLRGPRRLPLGALPLCLRRLSGRMRRVRPRVVTSHRSALHLVRGL